VLAYSDGSVEVDLARIVFGGDGSYYVTAPYHPANRAIAGKYEVNYNPKRPQTISLVTGGIEVATIDDDEQRLKLSHHPDGFLQFSGEGIRSGREADGSPKGLAVMTWPLKMPTYGPSFQLVFSDPRDCGRPTRRRPNTLVFAEADMAHMRRAELRGLTVIGYYFPPRWREFVYRDGNCWWMHIVHPDGQAVKRLRVILSGVDTAYAGLIGLEARPHGLPDAHGPGFLLASSTGNLRHNAAGDVLGDQLICSFPRPIIEGASIVSLNYKLPTVDEFAGGAEQ
jgi:hypothetical protein